jgi:hypothetical protein
LHTQSHKPPHIGHDTGYVHVHDHDHDSSAP